MRIESQSEQPPLPPKFSETFWYWLKLGFVSFGGPAGQIAIMHQDLVEEKRWISEKRFLHALNYCMLLPGPEAQQLATYIGWLMHGVRGGVVAGGLFVLPSFLILMILGYIYLSFGQLPVVAGILYGIKPAVVAIVLFAAYRIGARTIKNYLLLGIALMAFLAIAIYSLPFPIIVASAAVIGILTNCYLPDLFMNDSSHKRAGKHYGEAVISDDTPTPTHARFDASRTGQVLLVGVSIWAITLFGLASIDGWHSTKVEMAWFFTKAALLTFGGAYAVLPYVFQGAVAQFAWLTPAQMMDGLALGESTPGPLIMVVTFVGFVGGWNGAGDHLPILSAISAALVVTFFTFLPSFIFIFLGGPFIESSKDNIKLTAPLTAISAAVVGVIVSLAIFFAKHVLWPNGSAMVDISTIDKFALLMVLIGLWAIMKWNVSVIKLIGIFAAIGLLHHWLA